MPRYAASGFAFRDLRDVLAKANEPKSGDQLAGLDLGIEIDVDVLDLPRHLRADLHRGHRIQRAGGGHAGDERPAQAVELYAAALAQSVFDHDPSSFIAAPGS